MSTEKPQVVIVATGGTIAGRAATDGKMGYQAGQLDIEELIAAVPEAGQLADLRGIQLVSIGSQDMNDQVWLDLARTVEMELRKPEVSGVVVTHGTDTMEETAYFLHLIVDSHKPVVLTGSMRPAGALSADGPLNLFNSVAVAASSQTIEHGVLVVANDFIHGAREVTKTNTLTVQAFESSDLGLLGAMFYDQLTMYRKPQRVHTYQSVFSIDALASLDELPRVEIIYAFSSMQADLIDAAVELGAKGLVLAGVGNGNAAQVALDALARAAAQGVVVVRSTRSNEGTILRNREIDDDRFGFVVSDQLNPAKSRVLLQLALTRTTKVTEIQQFFWEY